MLTVVCSDVRQVEAQGELQDNVDVGSQATLQSVRQPPYPSQPCFVTPRASTLPSPARQAGCVHGGMTSGGVHAGVVRRAYERLSVACGTD
jgi:hypothetical protein